MSKPYVCTLDEATQKKALEELNEDPKNRQGAIDTFRGWIIQQKHIRCPTDDKFLLAFLRARKFSQLEARKLLENFLRRREKLSDWFKNQDSADKTVQKIIDDGGFLMLPGRDKEGRKVFIVKPGHIDVHEKHYKKKEAFRLFGIILDYMYFCDEQTQVTGMVTIVDFSKMTMAHQTKISLEERKNMIQTWQKNYPARIKGYHLYNTGPFIEFIMMLIKLAMSEKMQKRIVIHGHSLESLYKHVPLEMLPEEYLEDDYTGPNGGKEKDIIEQLKKDLARPEIRDRIRELTSEDVSIDMKEKETDVPNASFRKLNVD